MADADLQLIMSMKDQASANLRKMQRELTQLGRTTEAMNRKIGGSAMGSTTALNRLNTAAQALSTGVGGLGSGLTKAGSALESVRNKAMLVAAPLAALSVLAGKSAMEVVESENLFAVSMGEAANETRAWSEQISQALGLNATEVRRGVGTFNVMIESMGLGAKAANTMAKGLAQLAYDMSSFYNLSPDEMFKKLQAGISGEIEPLKRLGIVISEANVQNYAFANGIAKQGEELSEAQKVAARYGLIMERTAKAQGDLARTMTSPSNLLRRAQAQMQVALEESGKTLMPDFTKGLTWLTTTGIPAATAAIKGMFDTWAKASDNQKIGVLVLAGLVGAGGPLVKGLGTAVTAVNALGSAFGMLGYKAFALVGIAVALGSGLVAAFDVASGKADDFGEAFGRNMGKVGRTIERGILAAGGGLFADSAFIKQRQAVLDLADAVTYHEEQLAAARAEIEQYEQKLREAEGTMRVFVSGRGWIETKPEGFIADQGYIAELNQGLAEAKERYAAVYGAYDTARAALRLEEAKQGAAAASDAAGSLDWLGRSAREVLQDIVRLQGLAPTTANKIAMISNQALIAAHTLTMMARAMATANLVQASLGGGPVFSQVGKMMATAKLLETLAAATAPQYPEMPDWGGLTGGAGGGMGGAADSAERMANALRDAAGGSASLVDHMVSLNPAVQASEARISGLTSQLKGLESAQTANSRATHAAQRALQAMQEKVSELSDRLSQAKQRLQDLANVRLPGQNAMDDQIALAETLLNRLELAATGFDMSQLPAMSSAMQAFAHTVPMTVEGLREWIRQQQLLRSVTYDEQMRALQQAANPPGQEMPFAEALSQIMATRSEISSLEGQLSSAQAAVKAQEAAIRALSEAGYQIGLQIEDLNTALSLEREKHDAVTEALRQGYTWFVEDREKLAEMGGEAVTQASLIDSATQQMIAAITGLVDTEVAEARRAANEAVAAWEDARRRITGIQAQIPSVPTGPAGASATVTVPAFASGGFVPGPLGAPTLAVVHGGEYINPVGGRRTQGGDVYITVQGDVNGADLEDIVVRALERAGKRGRVVVA